MNEPKVSVIIPVYNVQQYLSQCLESIEEQTLREIEIICVDDGSTDESLKILEEHAMRDVRITILHQQNQYAGVARNNGMDAAHGEYLIFLDADDFFDPTLLEKTYKQAKAVGDADVVIFGAQTYNTNTGVFTPMAHYFRRDFLPNKIVYSRLDAPDHFLRISTTVPWTKLFRRKFILQEGIKFQPLHNSNDVYFVLTALSVAKKITYVDEDLTFYRIGETKNLQSDKINYPTNCFDAYEAVYEELNRRGIYKDVEKSFTELVLSGSVWNLETMKTDESRIKICRRLLEPSMTDMRLLDHPIDYYYNKSFPVKVRGAKYAVDWHDKLTSKADPDFHVLFDERSTQDTPLISVIIPVYNTADYLKECLDSVLGQTLHDIEIICVDDGSTDRSLDILLAYAQKDTRLAVFAQKNSGQSEARNHGVAEARGKYLYFMDSDDVLESISLKLLNQTADENALDVLCFNSSSFKDAMMSQDKMNASGASLEFDFAEEGIIYTSIEFLSQMLLNEQYCTSICQQFINKEFYMQHEMKFLKGIIHEDEQFTFQCMLSAERVGFLSYTLYHRRLRNDALPSKKCSFADAYGHFISFIAAYRFYCLQDLAGINDEMARQYLRKIMLNARLAYQNISPEEEQSLYGLPPEQRLIFELYIVDPCREKKMKESAEKQLKSCQNKASNMDNKIIQFQVDKIKSPINRIIYKIIKRVYNTITHHIEMKY